MRRVRLFFILVSYLLVSALAWPSAVLAKDGSDNISRSYNADTTLKTGSIVSTLSSNADYVEASTTQNADRIVGVVVAAGDSLVAVDPDQGEVQVTASGTVNVLVSTVNGDIKAGDQIAASPFSGIGMKAVGEGYTVGAALTDFTSSSDGATPQQVTDKNGDTRSITVGYVQISLAPQFTPEDTGDAGLNGMQRFVRSLTGHVVSTPRVIISLIIAILTIVAIIVLIYAAIYGSLVSIGRNPLAHVSILRALTRVFLMALLAFAVAFALIYLLLR